MSHVCFFSFGTWTDVPIVPKVPNVTKFMFLLCFFICDTDIWDMATPINYANMSFNYVKCINVYRSMSKLYQNKDTIIKSERKFDMDDGGHVKKEETWLHLGQNKNNADGPIKQEEFMCGFCSTSCCCERSFLPHVQEHYNK